MAEADEVTLPTEDYLRFHTVNPAYPEAHGKLYTTRRLCDAVWGEKWTRPVVIRVKWRKKRRRK